MKNVVYIVVDSLSQKVLDDYPFKDELFLEALKNKSIVCSNMYCQGPYTEANANGVFSGQKALDNSACLFFNDKCPDSLNDLFVRNNYTVYYSNWPAHFSPNYHDDNVFYDLSVLDMYRLNDLKKLLERNGKLSQEELNVARVTINKWMVDAIRLYDDYLDNKERTSLHYGLLDDKLLSNTIKHYRKILLLLKSDDYLTDVIKKGIGSILPPPPLNLLYQHIDVLKPIFDEYLQLFLKEQNKHMVKGDKVKSFLSNAKLKSPNRCKAFLRFLKWLFEYRLTNIPKEGVEVLAHNALNENILYKKPFFSMGRRVDDVISFLDSMSSKNSPFYICIQPQDFHQPSTFFTYDTNNLDLIESELKDQLSFAKRLPKSLKCNIFSHMSLRYIDKQIRKLYEYLEETKKNNNTIFVITSDHGYWNYYDKYPSLDPVDVMDEVRMHVPFMVSCGDMSRGLINRTLSNNAIPRTICELVGLEPNDSFEPSIFNSNSKYIISEYFNGGAPDVLNKPIHYIVRNERYKLLIIASINDNIEINNCIAFYDLYYDYKERHNLLFKKQYIGLITEMLTNIQKRHNMIKLQLNDYYVPPASWNF